MAFLKISPELFDDVAQSQGFDDGTVALDIFMEKVFQQRTAFTYQLLQRPLGREIFTV